MFFQSFIFEGIIKRMKIPTFILTVLSVFGTLALRAQDPIISADITQGCDSLKVNFSYTTTLSPVTLTNWDFGDGTTSSDANPLKNYTRPGIYTVSLTLNGTNTSTYPTKIYVGPIGLFINYSDSSELGPYTFTIRAIHYSNPPFPYTYQWNSPKANISESQISFIHQFDSAGIYPIRLIETDQIGCMDTFYRDLDVRNIIDVPNVFTPNDDTYNDNFTVGSNGRYFLSLKIFTRTGLLIYKTEAKTISWDGRLPSGEKVLPGIYFYIIETLDSNPPVKKNGFFYIFQ